MCLSVNVRKPCPILELPPRFGIPAPFGDLQAAVTPFCVGPMSQLRHSASCKTKGKLKAAHSKQCRFGYISSLKYNLVVMLGARMDIIQPQIRNLIAYLLPLPDKKTTTVVVKRDKTCILDRNHRQTRSHLKHMLRI